jgi:hypothetical protein
MDRPEASCRATFFFLHVTGFFFAPSTFSAAGKTREGRGILPATFARFFFVGKL